MTAAPARYILLFLGVLPLGMYAQNLEHIGKQRPFTCSGNIGGGMNFYHSNETSYTRDPMTWNLYGSLTPVAYGVSLPFSFVLNQYSKSYTTPFAQFGISPTYKWIKLHAGYRTMTMSPFIFGGQNFKGVGIELTPGKFRMAAFYGSLNKAISEDTTTGHLAMPQYGRKGYGARIGVGTEANHIDLIYFHARDDSGSIRLINQTEVLRPQENTVVGASMKFTFLHRIIWSADLAASALTQDLAAPKVNKDTLAKSLDKLFFPLIDYRNGTVTSLAGQTLLTLLLKRFTTTVGYRRVLPDFKSLGTPYMLNDIEALQWNGNATLAGGRVNLNANVNAQHNNVSKKAASELQNLTAALNLGAMLSTHASLSVAASAIDLRQKDGVTHLSDSVKLNQRIYNLAFTPSFTFGSPAAAQALSPGISYSLLDDKNPATAVYSKSNTLTATLNWSCAFTLQNWSVNGNLLYNRYAQGVNLYTSTGLNAGAAVQMLRQKNLGVNLSAGYLINHFSQGNATNNVTGSANVHVSVMKRHSFSAYVNVVATPPSSSSVLQQKLPAGVSTTNIAGGVSYNYSF